MEHYWYRPGLITPICLLLAAGNLALLGYWRLRVLQMGGGVLLRPGCFEGFAMVGKREFGCRWLFRRTGWL